MICFPPTWHINPCAMFLLALLLFQKGVTLQNVCAVPASLLFYILLHTTTHKVEPQCYQQSKQICCWMLPWSPLTTHGAQVLSIFVDVLSSPDHGSRFTAAGGDIPFLVPHFPDLASTLVVTPASMWYCTGDACAARQRRRVLLPSEITSCSCSKVT